MNATFKHIKYCRECNNIMNDKINKSLQSGVYGIDRNDIEPCKNCSIEEKELILDDMSGKRYKEVFLSTGKAFKPSLENKNE